MPYPDWLKIPLSDMIFCSLPRTCQQGQPGNHHIVLPNSQALLPLVFKLVLPPLQSKVFGTATTFTVSNSIIFYILSFKIHSCRTSNAVADFPVCWLDACLFLPVKANKILSICLCLQTFDLSVTPLKMSNVCIETGEGHGGLFYALKWQLVM